MTVQHVMMVSAFLINTFSFIMAASYLHLLAATLTGNFLSVYMASLYSSIKLPPCFLIIICMFTAMIMSINDVLELLHTLVFQESDKHGFVS